MYWDLPYQGVAKAQDSLTKTSVEDEGEKGLMEPEEEEEEENEEGKPLMGSQELVGSYGSVVTSKSLKNHSCAASNATLNHIPPPPTPRPSEILESTNPFKNFSISRGECFLISKRFKIKKKV